MESPPPLSSGLQVLQDSETYVIKIGGENATELKANADLARARTAKGKKQILAISALRSTDPSYNCFVHPDVVDRDSDGKPKSGFNTTSHLIAMAERLAAGDQEGAHELMGRVRRATKEMVRREIKQDNRKIDKDELLAVLFATINGYLDNVCERIFGTKNKPVAVGKDWLLHTEHESISLTGIGEYLAQAIYHTYFQMRSISVGQLDTMGLAQLTRGRTSKDLLEQEQVSELVGFIRNSIRSRLGSLLRMNDVVVVGGYLPVLGSQRGYGDKTGAALAQAEREAGHPVVSLFEKKSPIMSADPRKIPGARPVPEMTYEFAMEAFGDQRGADGGAIHPEALRMLAEYDIPAVVFNPQNETEGNVTLIHDYIAKPDGAEIVASRKMPIALQVQSIKMLGQAGFLAAVTQWFATREPPIPIDQVSTSEVTISFTFSNGDLPQSRVEEFQRFLEETYGPSKDLRLTVTRGKSLLFCMGNNMQQPGVARDATAALADVGADIHFIAQGLNERVMTFMVDSEVAPAALKKLHETCIERRADVTHAA